MHIIAIGGPSCAGKTALATELARLLPAPVLPLDAYYFDLADLPLDDRGRRNFDIPESLDHDLLLANLTGLMNGRAADRPVYDFRTHTRTSSVEHLTPTPFLVLEGLFALYWDDIRSLLGTKVFVDGRDSVCLTRRRHRDVAERGRTLESVLSQYEDTVRPMAELYVLPSRRFADVIVSGEGPLQASAAAVLARVRRHLGAVENSSAPAPIKI